MNMIEAISDPHVFGPAFANKESWAAWRAFLATLFALPMDDEAKAIFRECTGRNEPPSEPVKEAWLPIGRKGGKSRMLALIATYLAAFVDWREHLSVGERGVIMIVAQDRAAAQVIMEYISGNFHTVPMLEQLIERETADRIDLTNRLSIRVHTCTIRGVRGPTVVAALCDEIAFWKDENSANPDEEVIASVRPAMATIGGGLLLCASSPYARKGALWQASQKHYGKEGDPVLVWKAPTRRMNPHVPQSLIDSALERDPARYSAEYMAEFRGDIEGFVALEVVRACVDAGVYERAPANHIRYFGFVDPSGGSNESFTLAISHAEDGRAVLDLVREARPPFSPESVVAEFCETLAAYRVKHVRGDRYAGEWPREQFRKRGVQYEPADKTASQLFLELLPLINAGRVGLLDHRRLIDQLVGLERRTSFGGKDSVGHPPGAHDDLANAVAGALLSATAKPRNLRMGTIDVHGRVHWKDEEPERPRVRYVVLTEQEDLRRRGLL